jgi:hypothetical protein
MHKLQLNLRGKAKMRVPAAQLGLVLRSRAILPRAYTPRSERYSLHILLEEDASLCPVSYNE